jgi:type I restriction enzyme S subunit
MKKGRESVCAKISHSGITSSKKTLNEVCEFIVDCLHETAPTQDHGFPLIRTPNIGKGRLNLDDVYRVSEETYEIWTQRAVPQPDDLILA